MLVQSSKLVVGEVAVVVGGGEGDPLVTHGILNPQGVPMSSVDISPSLMLTMPNYRFACVALRLPITRSRLCLQSHVSNAPAIRHIISIGASYI
jgi:hypothetical protein